MRIWLAAATLLILAGGHPTASFRTQLDCNDCHVVTDFLQNALRDEAQRPEHEMAGDIRPRRRMHHPRSEPQIFRAVDNVCQEIVAVSPRDHEWFTGPCQVFVKQHRSALENHIYQEGVDNLRRVLCNELSDLCQMHDLHDHGEL